MLAGVFLAFSGAAAAGRLIERHVPKAIRGPAKKYWQRGMERVKERIRRRLPKRTRRALERIATAQTPGAGIPGWRGRAVRAITRPILGPIWALGRAAGRAALGIKEAEIKEIKERQRELEKIETPEKMYQEVKTGPLSKRIAALRAAREKGWIQDLKKLGLKDEEIVRLTQEAAKIHTELAKTIIKSVPHLVDEIKRGLSPELRKKMGLALPKEPEERERELERFFTEEERKRFKEEKIPEEVIEKEYLHRKITAGLSPSDIAKIDWQGLSRTIKEAKEAKEAGIALTAEEEAALQVEEAMHRFWSGREVGAAAREFGREFVDVFMTEVERRGTDWYALRNPKILRYLRGTPAEELGFWVPRSKTLSEEELGEIEIPPEKAPRRWVRGPTLTEKGKAEIEEKRMRKYYESRIKEMKAELERLSQKPIEEMTEKELSRVEELTKKIEEAERKIEEIKKSKEK